MRIQYNGTKTVITPGHGPTDPGDIVDLPDDQAQAMLDTRPDWSEPGGTWNRVESGTEGDSPDAPAWPLKSTPEEYLQKTPDGPKADLARSILNQKEN